ncbi:MAG: septum formation initiator family protein, partial [Mogibacterium sp.]|nr:septum formation initiator family protein [Mogibacterium sp.]
LKAENIALQKQQKELEEERDRLREEVENSGNREYVQEQARKQLRLLNPGELIFTFEDEEE